VYGALAAQPGAKAPARLREELKEDYRRMIYGETRAVVDQALQRFVKNGASSVRPSSIRSRKLVTISCTAETTPIPTRMTVMQPSKLFRDGRESVGLEPSTLRKYRTFTKQITRCAESRGTCDD
jgi:hypothetical protein